MNLKGKKLFKNIGYMFIGNFASKILSFLLVPLYTSVLVTEQYGVCDLIFTAVALLVPVFSLTIYEAMLRFSLDDSRAHQAVFMAGAYVALLGLGVLVGLSLPMLLVPSLGEYYWYLIGYYAAYMVNLCISYYVRGLKLVRVYSLAGFGNTACLLGLNLWFLMGLKMGVTGALWAGIIANLMAAAIGFLGGRLWRYVDFKNAVNKPLLKRMTGYSVPLMPNAVSWWISDFSDRYMLAAMGGLGLSGLYAVAYKIPSMIGAVAVIVNAAWQLSAVEGFGSGESKRFFSAVYARFFAVLTIFAGVIILFTRPLAGLLYKEAFFQAWRLVPVLTIAVVFSSLSGFVGTIFTSAKKTKSLMVTTLVGAGGNILLNLPLIYYFKTYGAAVATMISYLVVLLLRLHGSKKYLQFPRDTKRNMTVVLLLCLEGLAICSGAAYGTYLALGFFMALVLLQWRVIPRLMAI